MKIQAILGIAAGLAAGISASAAGKDLTVYFVDVEGGQSTLFVTPSGESVLVDAGWPGQNGRDADRIVAAAKVAGVTKIDYLLVTHFHTDHVGGVPALAAKIPIVNFVDHGETVEHDPNGQRQFDAYQKEVAKGKHIVVKPGDKLPIKGLDWTIVSAAGEVIQKPLSGAGKANPACADFKQRDLPADENPQSVGSYIQFGRFRTIDLGDLTWPKEFALMCPNAKVPPVDVFIVSHHGMDISNSAVLVDALHPNVAIMDNGARKGGTVPAWTTIHDSKGIQDIWQLHFAVAGGQEHNSPENVIANMEQTPDAGLYLKLVAHEDGHFEVTNPRNGFTKKY